MVTVSLLSATLSSTGVTVMVAVDDPLGIVTEPDSAV